MFHHDAPIYPYLIPVVVDLCTVTNRYGCVQTYIYVIKYTSIHGYARILYAIMGAQYLFPTLFKIIRVLISAPQTLPMLLLSHRSDEGSLFCLSLSLCGPIWFQFSLKKYPLRFSGNYSCSSVVLGMPSFYPSCLFLLYWVFLPSIAVQYVARSYFLRLLLAGLHLYLPLPVLKYFHVFTIY